MDDAYDRLRKAITKVRRDAGAVVEIMIVGDFNCHDQLWGGDEVSLGRQGEADLIIDLMNEFALSSLLTGRIEISFTIWTQRFFLEPCPETRYTG